MLDEPPSSVLLWLSSQVSRGPTPGACLLHHLIFTKRWLIALQTSCTRFTPSQWMPGSSWFLASLPMQDIFWFSNFCLWRNNCLNVTFLIMNEVKHLSMYLRTIWVSSFMSCLIYPLSFCYLGYFVANLQEFLAYSWVLVIPQSITWLYLWLNVLTEQKCFISPIHLFSTLWFMLLYHV